MSQSRQPGGIGLAGVAISPKTVVQYPQASTADPAMRIRIRHDSGRRWTSRQDSFSDTCHLLGDSQNQHNPRSSSPSHSSGLKCDLIPADGKAPELVSFGSRVASNQW